MKRLKKIINYFRHPTGEFIEKTIEDMGISKKDHDYKELKDKFTKLVGKRSNEDKFSDFCIAYSRLMAEKVKKELKRKDKKIIDLEEKKREAEKMVKSSVQKTVERIFLPNVFTIKDPDVLKIMKTLEIEGKDYKTIKRDIGLKNPDLRWKMNYSLELGLVDIDKNGIYSLSEVGKNIIGKRGKDFERNIELFDGKKYNLALKAVGNDEMQAKKLLKWLDGRKGNKHKIKIKKLYENLQDPKKMSQCFFCEREHGDTHEKHIGVKISDYEAAGQLLLLKYC